MKPALRIVAVGKLREPFWAAAQDEYVKRLRTHSTRLEIVEVADEPTPDDAAPAQEGTTRDREAERILSRLLPRDYVIALDGTRGTSFTSPAFAAQLQTLLATGTTSGFTFIIGGSLGLSDAVLSRANLLLSFGAFTLPHQLMRVVLLEQLFRAAKITAGQAYHK